MSQRKEGRVLGGSCCIRPWMRSLRVVVGMGLETLSHCLVTSELGLLPEGFGHEWPRPYTHCFETGRHTALCVSLVGAHYRPSPLGLGSAPPFLRAVFGEPC